MFAPLTDLETVGFAVVLSAFLLVFNFFFRGREKDVSWLFVNMNGFALFLFCLQQSDWLNAPSFIFVLLTFSCLFMFSLGYWAVVGYSKVSGVFYPLYRATMPRTYLRVLIALNRVGVLFFFVGYCFELYMAGWVPPLFAANKLMAYYSFPQPFIHYLVVSCVPISIVYGYLYYKGALTSCFDKLLILMVLALNVTMLARAVVMTQVFVLLYFYILARPSALNIRNILLAGFGLLLFLTVFGTLRTGDGLRVLLEIGGLRHWPTWMVSLAWPYLYFTTALENFRYIFELDLSEVTVSMMFGFRNLFNYLLSIIQLKDYLPSIDLPVPSSQGFNTYGLYLSAYREFYIFFPIYFLLFGLVVGFVRTSSFLFLQLFYPYLVFCIFTSPINDYPSQFFSFVYLLYLLIILGATSLVSNIALRTHYT